MLQRPVRRFSLRGAVDQPMRGSREARAGGGWLPPTSNRSKMSECVFPDAYKTVVDAPTRTGSDWLLPVRTEGRFPGEGGSFTMHIDSKTMLIQSQTGHVSGQSLTEYVQALARQPALPSPKPTC